MSRASQNAQFGQQRLSPQDRTSGSEEQTQKCPIRNGTNGFLDQQFDPVYFLPVRKHVPSRRSAERQIIASYKLLCETYGLSQLEVSDKAYPFNVLLCQKDAQQQLRGKGLVAAEIAIYLLESGRMCMGISGWHHFAIENACYIPVVNVVKLYQENPSSKALAILLMIFRYLHKVVEVPHYMDDSWAFVQDQFQHLMDSWYQLDTTDGKELDKELHKALKSGKVLKKLLSEPPDIKEFRRLLKTFRPGSMPERKILEVGRSFYELFSKYPTLSMYINAYNYKFDDDLEYGPISLDFFVSFVFDNRGPLHKYILSEVQYLLDSGVEGNFPYEQVAYIPDKPAPQHLPFERSLFPNIRLLINVLNLL